MKYIVTELNGVEQIFVFPRSIDHDRMFEGIGAVRMGPSENWRRDYRRAEVVSAGFVDDGYCHGKSETLRVRSRPAEDTALLQAARTAVPAQAGAEVTPEMLNAGGAAVRRGYSGRWRDDRLPGEMLCGYIFRHMVAAQPQAQGEHSGQVVAWLYPVEPGDIPDWQWPYMFADGAANPTILEALGAFPVAAAHKAQQEQP